MKKYFFTCVLAVLTIGVFAQSGNFDKRLLAKYSQEELANLEQNNPDEFKYINYCLTKAWYIAPLPKEKAKDSKGRVGNIVIKDIENINFYELNVAIIKDDYQFFAIQGTDKMLVVRSEDHIKKELK